MSALSLAADSKENDAPAYRVPPPVWVIAGMVVSFWPVWRWYGMRLNDGSDEPLGLVALAAAVWFLWRDRAGIGIGVRSIGLATAGLALYALTFPWLSSLPHALVALTVMGVAFRLHRTTPGIWGLLLLSLPVVATAQFYVGWPLRLMTAGAAEFLLDLIGMEISRVGTVLWWQGHPVGVDPPCSGIRMLWVGLLIHFLLLANHHVRLRALLWLTPVMMVVIMAGNVIRATLLFFKESGAVPLPEWTHTGIGLLVFGGILVVLFWLHRKAAGAPLIETFVESNWSKVSQWSFAVAVGLAMVAPLANANRAAPEKVADTAFPGWPESWEGRDLVPVPLTEQEVAFEADFPGRLAVFRTAEGPWSRRIILRWVNRPTRKLHSSVDCFRAVGFTMKAQSVSSGEGERWSEWVAYHSTAGRFRIRERLWAGEEPAASWTEVSAWFWDATLGRSEGPWWAMTVMEPESRID